MEDREQIVAKVADEMMAVLSDARSREEQLDAARAAITAVFDWLAEPSKEAISEGISTAEDIVDWTSDTNESWRIDTPSQYPMPIWKAMLGQLREEVLGDQSPNPS